MTEVWVLYRNEPGCGGRVVGVFSQADLAKHCEAIREWTDDSVWQYRALEVGGNWICTVTGEDFYLTVEPVVVDRLVGAAV